MIRRQLKQLKRSLVGPRKKPDSFAQVQALIASSSYFDGPWYLSKYPDVASHIKWAQDPAGHYLRHGAAEGRNPSEHFKTSWYLNEYPDVKQAAMNPLLHFILHGEEEGRFPHAKARRRNVKVDLNRIETLRAKAWSGYSRYALPLLEQKATEQQKSNASWHLASWYFAHGNYGRAIEYIEQGIEQSEQGSSRRKLVALVKCFSHLQQRQALQSLLKQQQHLQQLEHLLPYAEANLAGMQQQSSQHIAAINRLFAQFGLATIAQRDETKALALDNLHTTATFASKPGQPLVSVVIPAYNAAATIGIALSSLMQQSWQNLEVLVVDDASTDETAEVVKAWQHKDKRIRYLCNAENMGAYPARNHGMREVSGDFVTVHDSDDWSHPEKIERQLLPLLNEPTLKATYSSWVRVLPDLQFVGSWYLNDVFVEKNHSSLLLRRDTLQQTGLWDAVNVAADTEFLWRLEHHFGQKAIRHVLEEAPLSFALSDDSSLTRTKASHVKTIHYGLRRLYREASRWWHRQHEAGGYLDTGKRPFPAPLGIVRHSPREFDCLLVADFATATEGKLAEILAEAERRLALGERLCLFHWPRFKRWHGAEIQDAVFELCQQHGVQFAHAGIEICCPVVVMAGQRLTDYIPDQVVQVRSVQKVLDLTGQSHQLAAGLSELWSAGGVTDLTILQLREPLELPPAPELASLYPPEPEVVPIQSDTWKDQDADFIKRALYRFGFVAALPGALSTHQTPADIAHWQQKNWADWSLWLHPELPFHCFGERLAVIGEVFDPYHKLFSAEQVLQRLAAAFSSETDFLNALDSLSGKFALLVRHDHGWSCYHDAFAARSIFYRSSQPGVLASHASLLADVTGAQVDPECLTFIQQPAYKELEVKYLPGSRTLYRDIFYCPANHRLVMGQHKTERYWPRQGSTCDTDASDSLIQYLDGYSDYIKQQFDGEFFGLTGGLDSRPILAALYAKQVPLQCYTMQRGNPSGGSPADLRIAKEICQTLNIKHHEVHIDFKRVRTEGFGTTMQVLRANTGHIRVNAMVSNAQIHDQFAADLQEQTLSFSKGMGGEIMRGFYGDVKIASAKAFASTYGVMAGSPYVQNAFAHFVASSHFENLHGISVGDLLYWEHRMSAWAALGIAENDIFTHTFAAYNSRRLYESFMRQDTTTRSERQGFVAAVRHFCPQLMDWDFV